MCLTVRTAIITRIVSRLLMLAGLLTATACTSGNEAASIANEVLHSRFAAALQIAVSLPINPSGESSTPSNQSPSATTNTRGTLARPATLRILHIEDNPQNLSLMRRMFASMQNLTLLDAHTGELGIKLATTNPPALILLDMTLPGINGREVLRRLRNQPATRDIPVVAITNNSRALGAELGQSDFDDYIVKPVNYDRLHTVLNRHLFDEIRLPTEPTTVVNQ